MLCAAMAVIIYLLWPTWQATAFAGPKQLPITVGGMLFNVPSEAIRMRLQRRSGAQDRIDLAFAYPSLSPPERQKHVTAETVDDTHVVVDRLLLSIALRGDELNRRALSPGPPPWVSAHERADRDHRPACCESTKGGRRSRGAPFVAATFDLDQRDRLILVNAKAERGARQHAVD